MARKTRAFWLKSSCVTILLLGLLWLAPLPARRGSLAHGLEPKSKAIKHLPRRPVDMSGYSLVVPSVRAWDPDDSLEEIAAAWQGTADRSIANLDEQLEAEKANVPRAVQLLVMKSALCCSEGNAESAYRILGEARALAMTSPKVEEDVLFTIVFCQGVAALRRGENDNCIMCRGESSCILPISPLAVHTNPRGSRKAIEHFTEYLNRFPDDQGARWLLNLAHMTLGEYPEKVDPKLRLSLYRYVNSEFDIGKFHDVGEKVGVNRFNQAGGAIMDDFDNDGLLDLFTTTFDPTEHAAYFHNDGKGKFEDRSKENGLSGQYGGLVCVQADYDNDGLLDVFIPRGAWLPRPMRPSLLHNKDGAFLDATTEAGVTAPLNSNSANWADYDNDGLVDLFVACERGPHRLYHNLGGGRFEDVYARTGIAKGQRDLTKGSTWIDYDNDDLPDLFINNLGGGAALYHNLGGGTFKDVTRAMNVNGPEHGFSCWTFDFDNDGWLDIFATCYIRTLNDIVNGIVGLRNHGSSGRLLRNREGKGFEDVTHEAGVDLVYSTMGSNYGDFDNDGWLDFYLATGDPNISTIVPNRMFKNVEGKRFAEITGKSGTGHLQKGHAVAIGDWDRDGDVDLFVETGGAVNGDKYHNLLFQNPGQGNHSLTIKLVGKKSNRSAIGSASKPRSTTERRAPSIDMSRRAAALAATRWNRPSAWDGRIR